jgi:hypothetical protein
MADFTENYNLKKPVDTDFYNVQDFNNNADIIDSALNNLDAKIDSVAEDIAENISKNIEDFTEGTLSIARGGTGTNTVAGIKNNLGLGINSSVQFSNLTVSSLIVNNQTLNLVYTQETQPANANNGSLWAW